MTSVGWDRAYPEEKLLENVVHELNRTILVHLLLPLASWFSGLQGSFS
jgi:hypothetical protein